MKIALKNLLWSIGIFPAADFIRRMPSIFYWLREGCCGAAPPPVKRMIVRSFLRKYGLKTFVETGTYLGDTVAAIATDPHVQAISIELSPEYFKAAASRFASYPNVKLLQGDSGQLLPSVVASLSEPALFWLDGHYSGGRTGQGDLDTPISAELQTILMSPVAGHVILIDDMRCFDGKHDYPHLDELMSLIRSHGHYRTEISADIMRLTPRTGSAADGVRHVEHI